MHEYGISWTSMDAPMTVLKTAAFAPAHVHQGPPESISATEIPRTSTAARRDPPCWLSSWLSQLIPSRSPGCEGI